MSRQEDPGGNVLVPSGDSIAVNGCSIPNTEHRGITVRQLKHIVTQILLRCETENWKSTDPDKAGADLKPKQVTLYDLVEHFVKPTTKSRRCSYVELVANDPQKPNWFVSHWWGEPVFDFVACLEQHALDRRLGEDTTYWVCAYAVNQHCVEGELGYHPEGSPFYKAMQLTKGTVSVLDREAICFERIWCTFEISHALKEIASAKSPGSSRVDPMNRYLYDVYTISKDRNKEIAVGLTDGTAFTDTYLPRADRFDFENMWMKNQADRQSAFPVSTCRKTFKIQLEEANASRVTDKKRILNSIVGNDLNGDPPSTHHKYDELNILLRVKFAVSVYRLLLESEVHNDALEECKAALSAAPLRSLQMSFQNCDSFTSAEARSFSKTVPTSLETLELDYSLNGSESFDGFAVGFDRLSNLRSFNLNCSYCHSLTSIDSLRKSIANNTQLRILQMDFKGCARFQLPAMTELANIFQTLAVHNRLTSLHLNASNIPQESRLNFLWAALDSLVKLQDLALNFSSIPMYTDGVVTNTCIDGIGKSIRNMPELQSLDLDFQACAAISTVSELAAGLACTTKLISLRFNFFACPIPEENIVMLCSGIVSHNSKIISLDLEFTWRKESNDFGTRLQKVKNMIDLRSLIQRDQSEMK